MVLPLGSAGAVNLVPSMQFCVVAFRFVAPEATAIVALAVVAAVCCHYRSKTVVVAAVLLAVAP